MIVQYLDMKNIQMQYSLTNNRIIWIYSNPVIILELWRTLGFERPEKMGPNFFVCCLMRLRIGEVTKIALPMGPAQITKRNSKLGKKWFCVLTQNFCFFFVVLKKFFLFEIWTRWGENDDWRKRTTKNQIIMEDVSQAHKKNAEAKRRNKVSSKMQNSPQQAIN